MAKHLLSDRHVRGAKPAQKPYRLFDGDGLALWVSPSGAKSWQLRYRLDGKEQTATLGRFDRLSLAEARAKADEQRKLVEAGEHLTTVKRAAKLERRLNRHLQRVAKADTTFGSLARAWVAREARRMQWTVQYREEVAASLKNHLSVLDPLPVGKVTAALCAPLFARMDHSAPHMVEKVRRRLRAILDDSVEQGILAGNPLPAPRRRRRLDLKHYPAVTDLAGLGGILRAARAADPCKGIARAHVLLAFMRATRERDSRRPLVGVRARRR